VLRRRANDLLVADELASMFGASDEERELLHDLVRHWADGGIVLWHNDGLVLTWADGGVSRRVAAGHWG